MEGETMVKDWASKLWMHSPYSKCSGVCSYWRKCGEEMSALLGPMGLSHCSLPKQHLESLCCNFKASSTYWRCPWGGRRAEPVRSSGSRDCYSFFFFCFFHYIFFKFSKCWHIPQTRQGTRPVGLSPKIKAQPTFSGKDLRVGFWGPGGPKGPSTLPRHTTELTSPPTIMY